MKIKTIKVALIIALGFMPSMLKAQHVIETVRAIDIKADTDNSNHYEGIRLFTAGNQVARFGPVYNTSYLTSVFNESSVMRKNLTIDRDLLIKRNSVIQGNLTIDRNLVVSGKIGLGISIPSTGIHLKNKSIRVDNGEYQSFGNVILHPDVDNTGDDAISFRNSLNREMARLQDGSLFLRSFNSTTGGIIESNGPLRLRPGNDNTGDDRISFRNGTNEEMASLQDGLLILDQIRLNVTTFPDYVFATNYDLMPLEEVASYIKKNKHLPNMPTEAEVVKQGMNIGQINTILVEKIEELTLYVLQLKEQLDIQNKKIENINK